MAYLSERGFRPRIHPASVSGGSPIFALTIGINEYKNNEYVSLKGSVADADAIDAFLMTKLHVPRSQIISLRDTEATRSGIVWALQCLQNNTNILRGYPILIYFAGHGGETPAPPGWPCPSGKVQMLIPHDCGSFGDGKVAQGIPDYVLGSHLKHLADKKGDNIVVILDNCYSGTGTRSIGSGLTSSYGPGIRAVKYRGGLPKTLDDYGLRGENVSSVAQTRGIDERGIKPAANYAYSGQRSHTLLAACKSDEYAREANKRGVFTVALLQTLSTINMAKTTYKELLEMIPHLPSNQNPQCEGLNQDRILFSTQTIIPQPNSNSSELESKRSILYIYIHGRSRDRSGTLQVVFDAIQRTDGVELAQTLESAHISVAQDEQSRFYFDVHDINVNNYGLQTLPHTVSHDANFHRIFRQISLYEHHLRRVKGPPTTSNTRVSLEFLRLTKATQLPGSMEDWAQIGKIRPENLAVDGTGIDLVQDDSWYVIKLTNTTDRDLYPSLFYFDNCDYSIDSLYEPPSAGGHISDPPLKAGQSMIIGYGEEGVSPFVLQVRIRNPYTVEVGYLKLFVSTKYTDYSHIRQDSPFKAAPSQGQGQRVLKFYTRRQTDYFGSIMVPLVVQNHNQSYRAIGGHSQQPRAPIQDSVFRRKSCDARTHRNNLRDFFRKLGHHFQQRPSSAQLFEQFENMSLSNANTDLDEAFRDVQEMGSLIESLKKDVLYLEQERKGSQSQLDDLSQHIGQMEVQLSR